MRGLFRGLRTIFKKKPSASSTRNFNPASAQGRSSIRGLRAITTDEMKAAAQFARANNRDSTMSRRSSSGRETVQFLLFGGADRSSLTSLTGLNTFRNTVTQKQPVELERSFPVFFAGH